MRDVWRRAPGGERLWAYRYRTAGHGFKRVSEAGLPRSRTRETRLTAISSGFGESDVSRGLTLAELVGRLAVISATERESH